MPTLRQNMETNMLGITDPDMRIYRVFTLERAFDTILNKKLALVRPRFWDDPFENLLYQIPLKDADGNPVSIDGLRNRLYGQCWTRASVSDALWRIYSPYKSGVRVRATARKLLKAIWKDSDQFASLKYFIGEVTYHSQSTLLTHFQNPNVVSRILDSTARSPVKSLLLKRKAFQHEKEVRLVFQDNQNNIDNVVFFPIDPNSLFETLLFDPRMDPTTVDTFTAILRQNGFKNSISQSTLYKAPRLKGHII